MTPQRFILGALVMAVSLFARTSLVAVSQNYTPAWPYCSTTGNYTMASSYQVNLVKLMGDLPSGAIDNRGFNTSMAGSSPDTVFGLVMCYADRTWDQCQKCVRAATAGVQQACPYSREMKACYDACVLRYSNESFFFVADLNVAFYVWVPAYVHDMVGMNTTKWKLMSRLMGEASAAPLRLANDSEVFNDSDGSSKLMYGFVQCTRDLNASECTRCLTYMVVVLSRLLPNNTYGSIKGYSCYAEYQIGKDLSIMLPPPSPALSPEPSPPPPPPETTTTPQQQATSSPAHGLDRGSIAGATLGSLAGAVALCVLAAFIWRRMGRDATAPELELGGTSIDGEPQEEEFEKGAGPKRFHYRDLAVATRNFSEEMKLGEGGFGPVYRGYLNDMNLHVAIKRVSKNSKQGRKEYESEVKAISRLRHRNLVELIGWCHEREELLLVYEFMENGSLDTHIHNPENVLPWRIRREMVLGVGSALQYLHQDCKKRVVHRDIKPGNIMLDAAFNAKLGDFGFARLIDHGSEAHATVPAGTIGYVDPEYLATGKTSIQSDVYSFGVVLLEIACGRRATAAGDGGTTIHLVQRVWELFSQGKILDAADPRLKGEFDAVEMERVMMTALWCAHPDRTQRLAIGDAMNALRFNAQLPILPAEMPVAKFEPPQSLDNLVSGTTTTTGSFVSVTETSSLPR